MIKNDLKDNPDYSEFVYFDMETEGTEVLDVGVYYKDSYGVMSLNDFVGFVVSFRSGTFVAHYGAGFDFLFIIDALLASGFSINYGVSGSNGIAMFCERGKQALRFIDSYRISSLSLNNFSKSFSPELTKLKIDMLPAELKRYDRAVYYEYLERDVISLRNSYLGFMKQFAHYKLGKNPPITTASLAMKVFKNHLKQPILTSTRKTREYERSSYFGGVCWLSEPGDYTVNVYDINSMYPYVMLNSEFPSSYVGHWCEGFNDKHEGLWHCSIEEPYSGLPFTFDINTRTLSNQGSFILDRATILYFQSKRIKINVTHGYCYLQMARIFDYYDDLYRERLLAQENGDVGKAYALKLILNSLYGKFGQKDEGRVIKSYTQQLERELLRSNTPYNTDSRFVIYTEPRESKTAFPAIASFVTLRARLLLRQYSDNVNLIYCDTDSLHIPSNQELPVSKELGGLKLEYSGRAVYVAKKLYALTDTAKLVHKGVPKNSLTLNDYFGMIKGDRITVNFSTMATVNDVLSKGIAPGSIQQKHRTLGLNQ